MGRYSRRGPFLLGLLLWLGRAVPSAAVEGTCASPTVIPSGGGVFTGTTSGASAITLSCQTNTSLAPESVFVWTPAVSGTAVLSTAYSNFDTVLAVETQCGVASSTLASGCVNDGAACCGDCNGGAGLWDSTVTVTVTQGQPLFVIVDGYGSCSASTCTDRNSGLYRLVVTPPGASTTTLPTCPATTTTTTSSTTTTTVVPPSYPQNLQVHTISCGATPTVRLTWNASTRGTNPIAGYIVYKWNGSIGQFKPDHCSNTCPGGSSNGDACCPEDFAGGVLTLNDGVTCVVNAECTGNQTPWACCTGNGTGTCNAPGTCHFTEMLDTPGFTYYSVAAYDQSTPPGFSQPPSTCPSWSAVQQGGGTCGPYAFSGCTPWPCFQCTCDTTTGCNTGWCDPMASAKCGDCSSCLVTTTTVAPTTTTTLPSGTAWARSFGGTGDDRGQAVATDASGNVFVVGQFQGVVSNWGGACSSMTSSGGADAFVAKFSSAGSCLWRRPIGGSVGDDVAYGVAVDGSGNVAVVGQFQGSVDFGNGVLVPSAGDRDIFVAKYAAADGTYLWTKTYGSTGIDVANGVAVDASGNVFVTGMFTSTVNFGGTSLTGGNALDSFVLKLNGSTGTTIWAKNFVGSGYNYGNGISSDASGNVIVIGQFGAHFFPNPADNVTNVSSSGVYDIYVTKLTGTGSFVWGQQFGGNGSDAGQAVAVDTNGDVAITGYVTYAGVAANFGCGPVTPVGSQDIFIAKLAGADGHCIWSKDPSGPNYNNGVGIATDASNNVIATGVFQTSANFGAGTVSASGNSDAFVAKYTSGGSYVWAKHFGGPSSTATGNAVSVNRGGNIGITGSFQGAVNFGVGTLTSNGGADIILLSVAP